MGDRQLPLAESTQIVGKTDTLNFNIETMPPGEYFLRLRVHGVDSLLVDSSVTPPVFDSSQKVTL